VSGVWLVVVVVGAATVVFKSAGPVLLGGRELPPLVMDAVRLLAPTLFAALVVTQTFASERELVVDARLAGVAAGAGAVALRAPLLAVVVIAAFVTAATRAVA